MNQFSSHVVYFFIFVTMAYTLHILVISINGFMLDLKTAHLTCITRYKK